MLQEDALLSRLDIARTVGLSIEALRRRIERLREDGYLLGCHASVAPKAFGVTSI